MATDSSTSCPSCGARVSADAERCDLCGAALRDAAAADPRTEAEATPSTGDAASDASQPASPSEPDAKSEADAAQPTAAEPPAEESPVEEPPEESAEEPSADAPEADEPAGADAGASQAEVFCNQCGWKNPPGSRYCSRCGEALQDLSDEAPAPPPGTRAVSADLPSSAPASGETGSGEDSSDAEPDPADAAAETAVVEDDAEQQAMGQRLTLLVGVSVLVVVGLFFVTLWSQSQSWGSGESASGGSGPVATSEGASEGGSEGPGGSAPARPGGAAAGPDLATLAEETSGTVPEAIAGQADSLRRALDDALADAGGAAGDASGSGAIRIRRQLVNLYVGGGQPGLAAVQQRAIAEATGDVPEWQRAGDLFYGWMQQLQQEQQRQAAFRVAQQAADAYETVVEAQPDNLEVRTRMGEAYLLTNNPMRGIETINGVLADDSTFVPARFQKGLALLQINRLDQAVQEFERVKRFAGEGEPFYRQAERAIQIIQEQSSESAESSASGPSAPSR